MSTKSTLFALVLLFYSVFSQIFFLNDAKAELIQLRIWTDKEVYLTREPIIVHYEVENISDKLIQMNFFELGFLFKIKDQEGRSYNPQSSADYAFAYPDTLKPGESYKSSITHTTSLDIVDRYRIISPGKYTCFLENPLPEAKSNIIRITVKDPKGKEKKALDLYWDAQKLRCKAKDPDKCEQAFYKYLELVEKYPKSVYAPMSLYTALFKAHVIEDKNIVISVCKKLIENYPESYYIDEAFYNLVGNYKVLKDKAGAMEYMRELIKKYPNTKISESAEYWLGKTEKEEF